MIISDELKGSLLNLNILGLIEHLEHTFDDAVFVNGFLVVYEEVGDHGEALCRNSVPAEFIGINELSEALKKTVLDHLILVLI